MKKLMVMIGAAAAAFGLYADATIKHANTFEVAEEGVIDGVFTPADPWSGPASKVAPLEGEVLPYTADGDLARRPVFEKAGDDNVQFLTLETGSESLDLNVGDKVLDQIVKFTGFEEPQTDVGDAKIALWMASYEGDDDTVTNDLYITFGDANGTKIDAKLDGEYAPDVWYRLTIKSLGNVLAEGARTGFVVYINGKAVSSADAKGIFGLDEVSDDAKVYLKKGQLFTSLKVDEEETEFNSVSYKGIGGIDDVIVDNEGPAYVQAPTEIAFEASFLGDGAYVTDVLDADGKSLWVEDPGYYLGVPGDVVYVVLTADGKKFKDGSDTAIVEKTIPDDGNLTIEADEVEFMEGGFAIIIAGDDSVSTNLYETFAAAVEAATDGQTITVIKDVEIAEEKTVVAKQITLDATGFTVTISAKYPFLVNGGELTVIDGAFTQAVEDGIILWANNGKITVYGGDFSAIRDGEIAYVSTADATIDIYGGKFVMADGGDVLNVAQTLGLDKSDYIKCYGGSFSKDPAEGDDALGPTFVAEGYESVKNEETGLWDVVKKAPVTVKAIWFVGDVATTNEVEVGKVPEKPADPEKTGYTFTGWEPEVAEITEDTTYTAQFEAIAYTISYSFEGVDDADVEKIANDNPATYTIESDLITFAAASCEGYTFKGFDPATIAAGSTGNVDVKGTFEKVAPPQPVDPVVPGEDIKTDKTPAEIDADLSLKKTLLKAPDGATVGDDYYGYFNAVAGSEAGTVKFELNDDGKAAIQANANGEIVKIKPSEIAALTTEDGTFKIETTIPGFYYAVKQGNGIGNMKVVEAGTLATDANGVGLVFKKYAGAGFYQIVVSEKPIAAEN